MIEMPSSHAIARGLGELLVGENPLHIERQIPRMKVGSFSIAGLSDVVLRHIHNHAHRVSCGGGGEVRLFVHVTPCDTVNDVTDHEAAGVRQHAKCLA